MLEFQLNVKKVSYEIFHTYEFYTYLNIQITLFKFLFINDNAQYRGKNMIFVLKEASNG